MRDNTVYGRLKAERDLAEQTENLKSWRNANSKLSYLFSAGYRPGDSDYDATRAMIRTLERELREMQAKP